MNVLHIAPHLDGDVGKTHAALRAALPAEIEQTFVLLETPRDRRHADALEKGGARVVVADSLAYVSRLAHKADIVQFEFWNHPRLFECLACCPFPAMRSVFWSHVSGLDRPVIPPRLIEAAMRFVFTTAASLGIASLRLVSDAARADVAVIDNGFGAKPVERPARMRHHRPAEASAQVADARGAALSARDFMILWLGLLARSPKHSDFRGAIGESPADWFVATQRLPYEESDAPLQDAMAGAASPARPRR